MIILILEVDIMANALGNLLTFFVYVPFKIKSLTQRNINSKSRHMEKKQWRRKHVGHVGTGPHCPGGHGPHGILYLLYNRNAGDLHCPICSQL